MSVAETIEQKLRDRFVPTRLTVTDDSARHAGHAGARAGGETHFTVAIVSPVFAGLGRVARQRLVYETLAGEISDGVHALSLSTLAPGEYGPED
jgi:BolA protein